MHLRKYSVVTTNRFHCMVINAMHATYTLHALTPLNQRKKKIMLFALSRPEQH